MHTTAPNRGCSVMQEDTVMKMGTTIAIALLATAGSLVSVSALAEDADTRTVSLFARSGMPSPDWSKAMGKECFLAQVRDERGDGYDALSCVVNGALQFDHFTRVFAGKPGSSIVRTELPYYPKNRGQPSYDEALREAAAFLRKHGS